MATKSFLCAESEPLVAFFALMWLVNVTRYEWRGCLDLCSFEWENIPLVQRNTPRSSWLGTQDAGHKSGKTFLFR